MSTIADHRLRQALGVLRPLATVSALALLGSGDPAAMAVGTGWLALALQRVRPAEALGRPR